MSRKLKELVKRAQSGDNEAMTEIINRFMPLIKKYSRSNNSYDLSDELIKSLIKMIKRHKSI